MGRNQLRLLRYAVNYPANWHTWGTDKGTIKAVKSLESLGLLITNEYRQFRLALPQRAYKLLDEDNKRGLDPSVYRED